MIRFWEKLIKLFLFFKILYASMYAFFKFLKTLNALIKFFSCGGHVPSR